MRTLITLLPLALSALNLAAQGGVSQNASVAVFEVSSVRHNTSGDNTSFPPRWTPRRMSATNVKLEALVLDAFEIPRGLVERLFVVGGLVPPGTNCTRNCSSREEILSARFDIQATAAEDVPVAQQRSLLRRLLEERFKLKARLETREMPVYALTVAREGQLGPQLRRSVQDCGAWLRGKREGKSLPEPADPQGRPLCSTGQMDHLNERIMVRRGTGDFSSLVNSIRGDLDRPIVDRTGLTGNFEWDLTTEFPGFRALEPDFPIKAPSLDVALSEQLGLRLVRSTEPLQVLVIESIAMPTAN